MSFKTQSCVRPSKNFRRSFRILVSFQFDLYCSDWPTIPQLYINGEFVGGSDIVLDSMCFAYILTIIYGFLIVHKTGALEELLENSGIIPKIEEEATKS